MNRSASLFLALQLFITGAAASQLPHDSNASTVLGTAEAMASGLRGVDRAYAYWLIARDYSKINPKEELRVVRKSCEAAIVAEEDNLDLGLRNKIQFDCLRRLLKLAPKVGEELLARAEPDVRQQIVAARAVNKARAGNIDDALTMLSNQIGQDARYPYQEAMNVIKMLPPDDRADRDRVFAQALAAFTRGKSRFDVGMNDFGTMVRSYWKELSPGLVLEAIDALLDVAGQESIADSHLEISVTADGRATSFGSLYQYRLSQVLPVLRQLDPIRARDLVEANHLLAGAQAEEDSPGKRGVAGDSAGRVSISLHIKSGPAISGAGPQEDLLRVAQEEHAEKVFADLKDNPDTALRNALLLPDGLQRDQSTKADLLLRISTALRSSHPDISLSALRHALDLTKGFPPLAQARYLVEIANQYLKLDQPEEADDIVHQALKSFALLYKDDTDSDDPNLALKSSWPSTTVSRALVTLETRISVKRAEQLIKEISDPDQQVFDWIELASTLLKAPSYPALIQSVHKNNEKTFAGTFPLPGFVQQ